MKKVISVFLAVILALSTFAFGTTVSFADEKTTYIMKMITVHLTKAL